MLSASRKADKSAIRFATQWNQKCRALRLNRFNLFDFNLTHEMNGFTPLHYSCIAPSLNMINDLGNEKSTNAFALCNKLKSPKEYVPQQYLTSKKVITRYHNLRLKEYFQDPEGVLIPVNLRIDENYERETFTEGESNINDMVRRTHTSNKKQAKFLEHFAILYKNDQKRAAKKIAKEIPGSIQVPPSFKRRSNSVYFSGSTDEGTNVAENVKVKNLPNSKVGYVSRIRRHSNKSRRSKRGLSPAIQRNEEMGIESMKSKDGKIEFLNNNFVKEVCNLEKVYGNVVNFVKSSSVKGCQTHDQFSRFLKSFSKVMMIVSLYKPFMGMMANFGEGSETFKKFKKVQKMVSNLLELLLVAREGDHSYSYLFISCQKMYCNFMRISLKILSFIKPAKDNIKLKLKSMKLCSTQAKIENPIFPKNSHFQGKNIC